MAGLVEMAKLFTREGTAHAGATFEIEGKPAFTHVAPCSRCGGRGGSDAWKFTGWTCFRCGGGGREEAKVVRLFTADELEKLDARRAKLRATKAAKEAAKAAEIAAEREAAMAPFLAEHGALLNSAEPFLEKSAFLADVVAKAREKGFMSDKVIAAIEKTVAAFSAPRPVSEHVGEIGERLELPVTVERVSSFERARFSGRGTEIVHVTKMRTVEGHLITVMSPAFKAEKGESFVVRGTIKAHKEFRETKETILIRAAVIGAAEEVAA